MNTDDFLDMEKYCDEQIVIMQYTWLKTRIWEPKEIYEWDIVIANAIDEKCVVQYSEDMARFILIREWWTFRDIQNTKSVLWNIYENPELLDNEKVEKEYNEDNAMWWDVCIEHQRTNCFPCYMQWQKNKYGNNVQFIKWN